MPGKMRNNEEWHQYIVGREVEGLDWSVERFVQVLRDTLDNNKCKDFVLFRIIDMHFTVELLKISCTRNDGKFSSLYQYIKVY